MGHGSANVFTYSGGTWIGSPLISSYANFTFGWSVALNGNGSVAVVGAPQAFGYAGYAAVFQGGVEIPLTSTASVSPAYFGYSVSINDAGTSVVVGAPSACYAAVYKQTGGVWGPAQVLVSGLSRPQTSFQTLEVGGARRRSQVQRVRMLRLEVPLPCLPMGQSQLSVLRQTVGTQPLLYKPMGRGA